MLKCWGRLYRDESGQAIVEFLLLLGVALFVLATMRSSIKQVAAKIWSGLASRIAAPCAECSPEDNFSL